MSSENETNPFEKPGRCIYNCEAQLKVKDSWFYVCKEHLCKISEFFKKMFTADFKERNEEHFEIWDETYHDILVFLKALEMDPKVNQITKQNSELLMRLADKYQVNVLKNRLEQFILANCDRATPDMVLKWFICSKTYNMSKITISSCLPGAACASLNELRRVKEEIGIDLYARMIEAKLEASFQRGSNGKIHYLARLYARTFECYCGSSHSFELDRSEGCVDAREFYSNALKNAIKTD